MEEYEVSERSIYRYLEIINMIDPIEFDKEKGGYKFINSSRIKKIALKEDEFLMLIVMGEAISHLGNPLRQEFRNWADNLTNITEAGAQKKQFPVGIKIPNAIENEKLSGHFQTISTCIQEKRSIDMVYHTLYFGVKHELVWAAVKNRLPLIKLLIEKLLVDLGADNKELRP